MRVTLGMSFGLYLCVTKRKKKKVKVINRKIAQLLTPQKNKIKRLTQYFLRNGRNKVLPNYFDW